MVFVAFPKLRGPVTRHMAWKTRMQEVVRLVGQGPFPPVSTWPGQHKNVPTLVSERLDCPPPSGPLHLPQMGVRT